MKLCIVFIVAFVAFNCCSGQTTSCSSRIQNDVQKYVSNLKDQFGDSKLKETIQSRVNQYFTQFNQLRDRIISRLNAAGATAVAQRINAEFNNIVNSLRSQFNGSKLRSFFQAIAGNVHSQYLQQLEKYVNSLKAQVDKNPAACKCYDDNKLDFQSIVDLFVSQTKTVINDELKQLDVQIEAQK